MAKTIGLIIKENKTFAEPKVVIDEEKVKKEAVKEEKKK